jgi:hypothetical protein
VHFVQYTVHEPSVYKHLLWSCTYYYSWPIVFELYTPLPTHACTCTWHACYTYNFWIAYIYMYMYVHVHKNVDILFIDGFLCSVLSIRSLSLWFFRRWFTWSGSTIAYVSRWELAIVPWRVVSFAVYLSVCCLCDGEAPFISMIIASVKPRLLTVGFIIKKLLHPENHKKVWVYNYANMML